MDALLEWARRQQNEAIRMIRTFVECESPSDAPAELADAAVCRRSGTHLLWEFGKTKRSQLLALGHSDTVWPHFQNNVQMADAFEQGRKPTRSGDGRLAAAGPVRKPVRRITSCPTTGTGFHEYSRVCGWRALGGPARRQLLEETTAFFEENLK